MPDGEEMEAHVVALALNRATRRVMVKYPDDQLSWAGFVPVYIRQIVYLADPPCRGSNLEVLLFVFLACLLTNIIRYKNIDPICEIRF